MGRELGDSKEHVYTGVDRKKIQCVSEVCIGEILSSCVKVKEDTRAYL